MKFTDPKVKPSPVFNPVRIPGALSNIPRELRNIKAWVVWKFVWNESRGCWTKILYSPHTGQPASSTDPTTWSNFDYTAHIAAEQQGWDGIGFVFHESHPYGGIDLDGSAVTWEAEKPIFSQLVNDVFELVKFSYAEFSPSASGVHIIAKFAIPKGRNNQKVGIEMYSQGRYFTFTGVPIIADAPINELDEFQVGTLQSFCDLKSYPPEVPVTPKLSLVPADTEVGTLSAPAPLPVEYSGASAAPAPALPAQKSQKAPAHARCPDLDGKAHFCNVCGQDFTMPAEVYSDTVLRCPACLTEAWCAEYADEIVTVYLSQPIEPITGDPEVDEILHEAFSASNGTRLLNLFNGNLTGLPAHCYHSDVKSPKYGQPDLSVVDSHFLESMAFYTEGRPDLLDRIMRASQLYRPKWERVDYRTNTIDFAQRGVAKTKGKVVRLMAAPPPPPLAANALTAEPLLTAPPVIQMADPGTLDAMMNKRSQAQGLADLPFQAPATDPLHAAVAATNGGAVPNFAAVRPIALRQSPVGKLPLEVLPDWMSNLAIAHEQLIHGPIDYSIATMLGVISAVYGSYQTLVAQDSWIEPGILWFLNVGDPGWRKGPMMRPFVTEIKRLSGLRVEERQAVRNKQSKEKKEAEDRLKALRFDKLRVQREIGKLSTNTSLTPQGKLEEQSRLQSELSSLISQEESERKKAEQEEAPDIVESLEDFTMESLLAAMKPQEPIYAICEEASVFSSLFRKYSQGNAQNDELILQAYDGSSYTATRKRGGGPDGQRMDIMHIRQARMAIVATIQPDKLSLYAKESALTNSGLMQRFCPIHPNYQIGTERISRTPSTYMGKLAVYNQCINALYRVARAGFPFVYSLDAEAFNYFTDHELATRRWNEDSHTAFGQGWISKHPARILRLALILHIAEHAPNLPQTPVPSSVPRSTVEKAGIIGEYLYKHACKFETAITNKHADMQQSASILLRWMIESRVLSKGDPNITAKDILRAGLPGINDGKHIEALLDMLMRHHCVEQITLTGGGVPTRGYRLHPFFNDNPNWKLLKAL